MTARTRRANGEGGAPAWQAGTRRWKASYTAADGSRRYVYSRTPGPAGAKECRVARDAALERTRGGDLPMPGRLTVGAWMDTWVATWIDGTLDGPRTGARDYRDCIRLHIAPAIGSRPLNGADKLTPTDVKRMLNGLTCKGGPRAGQPMSGTSAQHIYDILHQALDRAIRDGKATTNAADGVDRPSRSTTAVTPWTDDQAAAFLASVEDDRLEALWNIVVLCGLRQGEVIGLRWADIDFTAGTLTVGGQLDRFTHAWKLRKGRKGNEGKAVTHAMPDRVADLLKARETAQKREQLRAGRRWTGNDQGLVFTTRKGTPIPHNNIGESWRVRVARVPGLPAVSFHGGRHYAASYQFAAGARIEEVAAFLGHADGSSVTRTYVHLTHQAGQAAAARANALPLIPRKAGTGR